MDRDGYVMSFIAAVQAATVPRSRSFSSEQRARSAEIISGLLAGRPWSVRFKLLLFLVLMDSVSLLRFGRGFRALGPTERIKILELFFDSKLSLLRKGFWGLNTLTRMGAYGQESVYPDIGYRMREYSDD